MYFFIPSWYTENRRWMMLTDRRCSMDSAEDDTVRQIRIARNAGREFTLSVPAYAPGLRRFLHEQEIWPVTVWSVFDELQGIVLQKPGFLSWRDAGLPSDIEWAESADGISGTINGRRAFAVSFGMEGELTRVDRLGQKEDDPVIRQLYDDRGFLSSVQYLQKGVLQRQEFLDAEGRLQFTLYDSGCVTFAPRAHYSTRKETYRSLDDLIAEVMQNYFARADFDLVDPGTAGGRNRVLIAADSSYDPVILRILHGPKIGLSFHGDRFDFSKREQLRRELRQADVAYADSETTAAALKDAAPMHLDVRQQFPGKEDPVDRTSVRSEMQQIRREKPESGPAEGLNALPELKGAFHDSGTEQAAEVSAGFLSTQADPDADVPAFFTEERMPSPERIICSVYWNDAVEEAPPFHAGGRQRQLYLTGQRADSSSETVLRKWDSAPAGGTLPAEPQLPLLEEKSTCAVRLFALCGEKVSGSAGEGNGAGDRSPSLLLRADYYAADGSSLGTEDLAGGAGTLHCPAGLQRYTLSLILRGGGRVLFHRIELQNTVEGQGDPAMVYRREFTNPALCVLLPDCSAHMYRMPEVGRLTNLSNICQAPSELVMPAPFRSTAWLHRPEIMAYTGKYFIACTPETADAASLLEMEGYGTAVILREPRELYGISLP